VKRTLEPELMDLDDEVDAYAAADFREVNARFASQAMELVGERPSLDVLDIGCGPAEATITIAVARPGWRVLGVDASEPMLAVARKRAVAAKAGPNIRFDIADAKAISASLGPFDLIISNSLLHHLPDPAGFWDSIKRIAKPRATIFIRDLARPADEATARRIVDANASGASELLREEFYRSLLAAFTIDEVREQIATAGLTSLRVERSSDRHLDVAGML
jgi:2-polyprenyl-3-methyl-5-hydroxy-6-metoxy-1,4-benzoquinol methylase